MTDVFVRTGNDSYVREDGPTTNSGLSVAEFVRGTTSQRIYTFLYFKSPVPNGATVLSATLRLYGRGVFGSSITVACQRVAAKWSESTVNWSNQPAVTGSVVSVTLNETVDAQEWAFDVTALLQTIANGAANYGFRLSTAATGLFPFYSLNASDHRPVLEVSWSDAPDAPVELSPAGGASVTLAKPTLQFNFHDVSGSTAMAACQVQIDPGNSFGSPAFDSGTVSTSDPELDLTTTAYAGLSVSSSTWWRVRVQDAAGLWSAWSTSTQFSRVARGTLTINNPAAFPSNFVEDAVPQLSWTLSGATQTARQVIIADDAYPTQHLLDTGRQATTASTYTPPPGVIKSETTTYRLTVRVWDDLTRTATPGDLVFTEAVRTFTFNDDAAPVQVTSLVAAQQTGLPRVALTWNRATAPDSYSIWRDGVNIATDLDPASLFVSGTAYKYVDGSAGPFQAHTWKVRPKVSGVLGQSPTTTLTYTIDEIWLHHVDTGKLVPIIPKSGDQLSFGMPETSTVYRPINGIRGVTVVQGKGGLNGTVSGSITDRAGFSADSWVANLLWMLNHPANDYRLTLGEQNLRVNLNNVVIEPHYPNGPASWRQVSFGFESLDGPTG